MKRNFSLTSGDKAAVKGFTLIELLVVIAIISLLVSILLPSLQRAKELAQSAVCMSQLRHSGSTLLLYAEDYNGINQLYWEEGSTVIYWAQLLSRYEYIDTNWDGFVCPSWPTYELTWWVKTYGTRFGGAVGIDDFEVGTESDNKVLYYLFHHGRRRGYKIPPSPQRRKYQ